MDVGVRPSAEVFSVANEAKALGELVIRLKAMKPGRIILQASGGYEVPVEAALAGAQLPVVVVNARQVRDFARATGTLAKSGSIDAGILAWFGEAIRSEVRALKDEETQALAALLNPRRQLVDMLTADNNRLSSADGAVRRDIKTHIKWFNAASRTSTTTSTRRSSTARYGKS